MRLLDNHLKQIKIFTQDTSLFINVAALASKLKANMTLTNGKLAPPSELIFLKRTQLKVFFIF